MKQKKTYSDDGTKGKYMHHYSLIRSIFVISMQRSLNIVCKRNCTSNKAVLLHWPNNISHRSVSARNTKAPHSQRMETTKLHWLLLHNVDMMPSRVRNIDNKHHACKKQVQLGNGAYSFCPSSTKIADCITKAVPRATKQSCNTGMGLKPLLMLDQRVWRYQWWHRHYSQSFGQTGLHCGHHCPLQLSNLDFFAVTL